MESISLDLEQIRTGFSYACSLKCGSAAKTQNLAGIRSCIDVSRFRNYYCPIPNNNSEDNHMSTANNTHDEPSCEETRDGPAPDAKSDSYLDESIIDLQNKSDWLNKVGVILVVCAGFLAIGLCAFIYLTTQAQLCELNKAKEPYVTLIFLVVRSSALGGVAITILVALMRIANACFDQSARFAKRRYGAFFLKFLYAKYSRPILHGGVNVENIMKFFESWNQNVESAFSNVKLSKKGIEPMKIDANKDQIKVEVGSSQK